MPTTQPRDIDYDSKPPTIEPSAAKVGGTAAILYLESAYFMTGEALHVDGGQSAGH